MSDITYAEDQHTTRDKREKAAALFGEFGFDALYYHPKISWFTRNPNLFVLSRKQSNHLYIVLHGTELFDDPNDILTNLSMDIDYDTAPEEGALYLPTGHKGYRKSAGNLLDKRFVSPDMAGVDIPAYCASHTDESPRNSGRIIRF